VFEGLSEGELFMVAVAPINDTELHRRPPMAELPAIRWVRATPESATLVPVPAAACAASYVRYVLAFAAELGEAITEQSTGSWYGEYVECCSIAGYRPLTQQRWILDMKAAGCQNRALTLYDEHGVRHRPRVFDWPQAVEATKSEAGPQIKTAGGARSKLPAAKRSLRQRLN